MLAFELTGQGPALTLLHGFLQDRRSWDEVRTRLGPGLRVVAVDLPGHGESRQAPPSLPAATAGLLEVWDRAGVAQTHLVGYSLGGRVALHAASTHPERIASLFTLGAHAGLEGEAREARRRQDEALAGRVEELGLEWFATYWASQPLFAGLARRGPDLLARLDAMRRSQDPRAIAAALRGMGAAAEPPFWDRLGSITARSTFAAGARDQRYIAAAQRLAAAVPDGRAATVADAGHAAHLESPAAFAAVLTAHLSTR